MRFSLHDNTDWEDLGPFAETTKVENKINTATSLTVSVPASNFAKFSTLDDDWVASSTAKYICVTPDGVDYSDLNSNFDTAQIEAERQQENLARIEEFMQDGWTVRL